MTKKSINDLHFALLAAKIKAYDLIETEDNGTCNFDSPMLILEKEWSDKDIREAFNGTGLQYFRKDNTVEIYNATNGQGYRRTAMAEAFRDSLIKMGFKSYVYYLNSRLVYTSRRIRWHIHRILGYEHQRLPRQQG